MGAASSATTSYKLPRNAAITLLPAEAKLMVKAHYVRRPDRKSMVLTWASGKHRPNPDALSKAEWTRLTGLLMKLCESAFT